MNRQVDSTPAADLETGPGPCENARLRIAVDYAAATRHAPGIGRYARELVRALAALEGGPALHLLDVGRDPSCLTEPRLGLAGSRSVRTRLRGEVSRRAATLLARPTGVESWLGGLDHVHQVLRPLWPVARATTSLALSELPLPGTRQEQALRLDLRSIDQVFVFSADFERRVRERLGVPPERLHQVPVGCDHWIRELDVLPERDDPPFLLVLGALREARSPLTILEAFEDLVDGGLAARLVFAGRSGDAAAALQGAIDSSHHGHRVTWRTDIGEDQLPGLVARAGALVHLSHDEGTPVTPLEALAVGTPVVASHLPAFHEALAEAAEWVPGDLEGGAGRALLREAMARALASSRDEQACERRRALAAPYSWHAHALATLKAWQALPR